MDTRISKLPIWKGDLHVAALTGGLSNESFAVTDETGKYVVRFSRDFPFHHVSREREIMAARAAHAAGFAPEVVYAEPGIMVSRFLAAKTYGAGDVRANIPRIADLACRFHTDMPAHVSGPGFIFWVFHVIRDYARTLQQGGSRMVDRLPEFLALSDEMEKVQIPMPIIWGHHDFLPANFMDDGEKIWLIDFEYAGFSTPMFDLAGIASNAGFSAEEAELLLARYTGQTPNQDMRRAHSAMQCASLLREAMWSMVSELYLDAPSVDYVAYTDQNLTTLAAALDTHRTAYGRG